MISETYSWHAGRAAEARPAGWMADSAPVGARADADGASAQRAARFDPLTHPVAITGHSLIGDQLRSPAAGCAMAGCGATFADPSALGETDNRARAIAVGWVKDALDRLVCPACQRDRPLPPWWVHPQPVAASDQPPADGTSRPAGATGDRQPAREAPWPGDATGDYQPAGGISRPAAAASQPDWPAVPERPAAAGRDHRTQWPRLRSVLGSGRDSSPPPARSHRASSAPRSDPADPRPGASVPRRTQRRP